MNITLRNIRHVFFEMEESERLFDQWLADGTYYWDLIRLQVFSRLHAMHGGSQADPLAPQKPSPSAKVKDLLRGRLNQLTRVYLKSKHPEYLFITNQRIKRGTDLIDNIADHLLALVAGRSAAFEIINRESIDYWRLLTHQSTRLPLPSLYSVPPKEDLSQVYQDVAEAVDRHFHCPVDLHDVVPEAIATFRQYRHYFRQLFAEYRPKAVVVHNNGMFKGLFAAAKEVGVPTVELQHGASCSNNVFWSYPPTIPRSAPGLYVPTAYLTFSDYWESNTYYPVRTTRTIGNDFFDHLPTAGDENHLVFISAHMFHEELAALALELASALPEKIIYYKLHPHQYKDKQSISESLKIGRNIIVVSDETDISDLFQKCAFVVGVHSTLLYTALQAGKKVCIYKRFHYFWHEDIFAYTEQFDDVSELTEIVAHYTKHFCELDNRPVLFEPFDAERFRRALDDVEKLSWTRAGTPTLKTLAGGEN